MQQFILTPNIILMSEDSNTAPEKPNPIRSTGSKRLRRFRSYILKNITELVIVFTGLVAALMFDGHVQEVENREEYIADLRGIYGELAENCIIIDGMQESLKSIEEYMAQQVADAAADFSSDRTASIFLITNSSPTKDRFWLEVNRSVFENRGIRADLRLVYDELNQAQAAYKTLTKRATELGSLGYEIKYAQQFAEGSNAPYSRWYYLATTTRVMVPEVQGNYYNAKAWAEKAMRHIAAELERLNVSKDAIFSPEEKANFAVAHIRTGNMTEATRWGLEGLHDIDSYTEEKMAEATTIETKGTLSNAVGIAYLFEAMENNEAMGKTEKLLEAKKYIELAIDCDPDPGAIYLYLASIEARLNNQQRSLELIEQSLKSGGFNRGLAKSILPMMLLKSDEVSELLRKYGQQPVYPHN
ncbi:hypothetical protein N9065_03400 [Akkermansiaceae bacterium]|nr:hypothetical protein [Akkermansiaceae bacterium]MDB4725667.1 hypothetical protein [Akkermansiaceae bacterium]